MQATKQLSITANRIKLFGKTETIYQVCRGNDVIGVYCTKEEAESAMEAAK